MCISPGLRERRLFVGDSLLTVAAVLVCIQAEREGGDSVLVCFNSPELREENRLADGSLRTIAAIFVRIQEEREYGYLFWCVLLFSYHVPFSRAARRAPACRQLSTHGCGGFGLYTSGTGRWGFGFGMFKQFYTMYITPGLRGGHALAGGSLFTVAVILVCI